MNALLWSLIRPVIGGRRLAGAPRLTALRRYLTFSAAAHAAWEMAHVPLYRAWWVEPPLALAGCVTGDTALALGSLALALSLVGDRHWPVRSHGPVGALTVAIGLVCAVAIERLAVGVFGTWAYADAMPMVPLLGVGLSPMAQWTVIPLAALCWTRRRGPTTPCRHGRGAGRTAERGLGVPFPADLRPPGP